jgi:flagellar hook-associated protein 3 FlgL
MRVTDTSTLLMNWHQLQDQRQSQDRLQQQLSSGKRINMDSDDPVAANEIQALRRQMAYMDQYRKNASHCDGVLKYNDSTLDSVSGVMLRLITVASQATSLTADASARKDIADQIRSMKSELMGLGNTKYQGRYVFGGTQNLTAPFAVDTISGAIVYNGNDTMPSVPVYDGVEVQCSISGKTLLGVDAGGLTGVFVEMDKLAAAVEAGDVTRIAAQIGEIEKARQAVSNARGTLGHQMQVVEQALDHIDQARVTLQQRVSVLEDADIGEVVSRLTLSETAITATLYAQGKVGQRTLFDFIG